MVRATLSRIIADRARADPDQPIVIDASGRLSARELDRAATSLAHALRRRGVAHDDTVAIGLPNTRDFVIACAAVWRAGATPQPVSPHLTRDERSALERISRPAATIGARPATAGIAWLPSARVAPDARALPDAAATSWKAVATSGSTGHPKIVRAAGPALLDPALPVASFLPHTATQLVAGPMWHSAVFTYAFRGLLTGHRLVIMPRFDPRRWIDLVEAHDVTWGLLVPTMMARLMNLPPERRDPTRLSSIERVLHMGAPCAPDLKHAFLKWIGADRVDEVYAGSESNGLTRITGDEWLERPGSVGRGISGTRIRILNDAGEELPAGAPGLIWMRRGDAPSYEYVGAESRRDDHGWDTLGDIGHLDEDGYLYVHDRADDIINRGGEKIAPAAVEAVLESHPAVREAVVFGVADVDLGQAVHAVVRLRDKTTSIARVRAYAVQRLGPRAPEILHLTERTLRNDAGKIRRKAYAAWLASGASSAPPATPDPPTDTPAGRGRAAG